VSWARRIVEVVKSSTTITTWYSRIPLIINVFLVLPLVLRYFDLSDVALYYLVGSFMRYQDIADLGFGFSYSRYYSYAYAGATSLLTSDIADKKGRKDKPQLELIAALYKSNRRDYAIIAFFFMILIGGYATYQMREYLRDEVFLVTWLSFVFSLGIKVRYKFVESFIVGVQELARLKLVTGHFAVAQVIILFLVLLATKSIYAGIWTNVVFFWLIILRNYILAKRIFKEKGIAFNQVNPLTGPVKKELVSVALKSGWGNLVTSGFYTSSGFIFAPTLSELNLAILTFSNRIIDVIRDFSRAPFYSKLPELNSVYVKNRELLKEKSKKYIERSTFIYLLGVIAFLLVNKILLKYIGGELNEIPNAYWIFLGTTFFLERIGSVSVQLYSVSNKVKYHIINTVFFIVSLIVLLVTISHGIYSYPLAITVGLVLVYVPASLVLLYKEYQWSLIDVFRSSFLMFLIFIVTSFLYDQFL